MKKAYSVLGIRDLASVSEIEKAYRYKKRLYDLSRFVEGSMDWQFARARNQALDEAYRYAKAAAIGVAAGGAGFVLRQKNAKSDKYDERDVPKPYPRGEFWGLVFVCPVAVYVMQLVDPAILYELAPRSLRGTVWLLNVAVLFLGYFFPLLTRFVFLRRPVRNFVGMLLLFPFTMLSADIFTSVLLRFTTFPGNDAVYVPAFYLLGLGPLFVLLHAHCAILRMSFPKKQKPPAPTFRRLAAHTFTLALSMALSIVLCAIFNSYELLGTKNL